MAEVGDLIDFEAIETQKENIQSLPGGRSAKQLSLLCSPLSSKIPPSLNETSDLRAAARADFEKELDSAHDADDPLDIYDRYIKWTLSAYPSASSTPTSGLLPLLERATRSFIQSSMYKNDPRYLKLWLLYIHLFADAPRETYAYLATHGIGAQLALFYEEFAAWLEAGGRWVQAEEVFAAGVERGAQPAERLVRKYAEFQHRREARTESGVEDGPKSPALPRIRPALAAKMEVGVEERDPQARDREASAAAAAATSRPKGQKSKLAIFADGDEEPAKAPVGALSQGWDNIGTIADRKKENTHEAKPWAGERLDGGKKLVSGQKMTVFRDPVSLNSFPTPFPQSLI
jgi:checkpoint serine/threonine-protein kinase